MHNLPKPVFTDMPTRTGILSQMTMLYACER